MSGVALHPNRTSLGLADQQVELSPNVGDGRGQGGLSFRYDSFGSVGKFAPRAIFGNWLRPLKRRQLFSAASPSLMTLVVRRCFSVRLGSRSVAMFDKHSSAASTKASNAASAGRGPRRLGWRLGVSVSEILLQKFVLRISNEG